MENSSQLADWVLDIQADIDHAETQARQGPFFPELGVTAESLRAYADECRKLLSDPGASLAAALCGD